MLEGKLTEVRQLTAGSAIELVGETATRFKAQYADKPPRIGIVESTTPHYKQGEIFLVLKGLRGRNFVPLTAAVPLDGNVRVLDGKPRETVLKTFNRFAVKHLGETVGGALNMTIGSDPEIFAVDEKGTLIPAFEYLSDKKTNPHEYWDGFQAEIAPNAQGCLAYHVDSIQARLSAVHGLLKAKFPKGKLTAQNVIEVPADILTNGKDEHVVLGCDPSENAYGLCGMPVDDGRKLPIRFAGGHIHFGIGKALASNEPVRQRMMESLDAIMGVAAVSMAANIDKPVRRQYYGLPGEFRLPPHGLEYRTLSNFWLCSPAITHLVIDLAREAVKIGFVGVNNLIEADMDAVRACIVEHDVDLARKIIKANRNLYSGLLTYLYRTYRSRVAPEDATKYALQAIEGGVETVVKDPMDVAGNWHLTDGRWRTHSEANGCCWGRAVTTLKSGTLL